MSAPSITPGRHTSCSAMQQVPYHGVCDYCCHIYRGLKRVGWIDRSADMNYDVYVARRLCSQYQPPPPTSPFAPNNSTACVPTSPTATCACRWGLQGWDGLYKTHAPSSQLYRNRLKRFRELRTGIDIWSIARLPALTGELIGFAGSLQWGTSCTGPTVAAIVE